jgi:4-aminobutyrate aminotransferase-like enzyme
MRGLAAARDLIEDTEICKFHINSIFSTETSAADDGKYYVIKAADDKVLRLTKIDSRRDFTGAYDDMVAALANHAPSRTANAKIVVHHTSSNTATAALKACKKIKQGDAILANYGSTKWSRTLGKRVRDNKRKYPNLFRVKTASKKQA